MRALLIQLKQFVGCLYSLVLYGEDMVRRELRHRRRRRGRTYGIPDDPTEEQVKAILMQLEPMKAPDWALGFEVMVFALANYNDEHAPRLPRGRSWTAPF